MLLKHYKGLILHLKSILEAFYLTKAQKSELFVLITLVTIATTIATSTKNIVW